MIRRLTPIPRSFSNLTAALLLLLSRAETVAHAQELEGFTEPYRTINVASDETGIVEELLVREGDPVKAGRPLVRLNSDIHLALLAIAEQNMRSTAKLDAARAELRLRRERLEKLQVLRKKGDARQEEVDRGVAELAVAEANERAALEDALARKLEYEKVKTQIERRTIRAPIAGVVTTVHKQQGEFVAPNNPELLTIVQLDTLLANFTVMSGVAVKLRVGQKMTVRFPTNKSQAAGVIEYIAPVTDAESGTVRLKIRVANPEGHFRSGERCKVRLSS